MDGEAPERGWSSANDLAYSTREMGPGSRRDTLDDCFGDTNWTKAVRMCESLARSWLGVTDANPGLLQPTL